MAARRLHPPGDPAEPVRPVPARVVRPVISATSLSCSALPSWVMPGFHAAAGRCRMASSSASMMLQPQVNSTFFLGVERDSRWPMRSWRRSGPSTRTRIWRRNRAGTCLRAAASTSLWSVNVFDPALGPQQHVQALAGVRAPGGERVEAVAHLPGGRCSFLVRAGGDEGGVHVDDQPPRQRLARDGEPGEPGGRLLDQVPGMLPGLRPRPGDPVQYARGPGQVERTADRRPAGGGS